MKRPIAMRCNQEQFDSIKDRIPYEIRSLDPFDEFPYLVNDFNYEGIVSNIYKSKLYDETYETFNADIFLEACGVEVSNIWNTPTHEFIINKVWKGTDLQFKDKDGNWIDCTLKNYEFRLKPQPDYTAEIAELENKIKELKRKML